MKTRNPVDYPLHELLAGRWSPSGFADRSVPVEDLRSLFEAARWAPSAFNEQPWRYLVARKEEGPEYQRLLSCLVEANQAWARTAPVLAVTVARSTYTHNDRPNGSARHDIGLATACLTVEAAARGLYVHQMAGILLDRVSGQQSRR